MNPPGLIPFGVSVLERACMNPPGLIPFGVSVLERRYSNIDFFESIRLQVESRFTRRAFKVNQINRFCMQYGF